MALSKTDTTALKGLAILFVLLGHMNYLDSSGAWGVHIFLILSGFGLEISYQKNGLNEYWKKRIVKVFLPYEFVILLALTIERIVFLHHDYLGVAASILGLDFGCNIDHSMWYVSYLFLLYGEFYIWKKYGANRITKTLLPVMFILFNFALSICDKFFPLAIWSPTAQVWLYVFDFFVGIILVHISAEKHKKIYDLFVIVMILYFVVRYNHTHFKLDMLLFTLSAAAVTIGLGQKLKIGRASFFLKLGECSYFIYLIEGHLLRWKGQFLCWIQNENIRNFTVLVLCMILGFAFQRIFDILYSRMGGGKKSTRGR